jgi:hypothetical protein
MNPFFEIRINGVPIEILQPVTNVKSVVITKLPFVQIPIPTTHTKAIAEWLYNITQQVDYVEYNKVLIPKEDINKPSHL